MKTLSKGFYYDALDALIDIRPKFVHKCLLVLRNVYDNNLSLPVHVSIIDSDISIYARKDDREMQFRVSDKICYCVIDWNSNFKDDEICEERGDIEYNVEEEIFRLTSWLLKGDTLNKPTKYVQFNKRERDEQFKSIQKYNR